MTDTATRPPDEETPTAWGTITNTCTCTVFDWETEDDARDEDGNTIPADTCYGCYEDDCYLWAESVAALIDSNREQYWTVQGFRLWWGETSGGFYADTPARLLESLTVNSEWTMTYRVFPDRIEYSLAHHDAPTGSSTVCRPAIDPDRSWQCQCGAYTSQYEDVCGTCGKDYDAD
jgi:hypothetical protein